MMKEEIRTYWPYVFCIFFFNSFPLPHGMLYTVLLTPVFIYFLRKKGQRIYLPPLLLFSGGLAAFHIWNGALTKVYLTSFILFFCAFVFLVASAFWARNTTLQPFFSKILKWNSLFILIALLLLPFAFGRKLLWYEVPISPGISPFPRLKLFTYEAAYYMLLFAPVFLYYFWKLLLGLERHWLSVSIAILAPTVLSFSFGVMGGLAIAVAITFIVYGHRLINSVPVQKALLYGSFFLAATFILLLVFYPDNPLFERTMNILTGRDTSANGRLFESFMFAYDLAASRSLWFGVGLGHIKIFGHDLIINFYKYEGELAEIVRIPNSMAEWLATYGVVGFIGKLAAETYFFFRCRVYKNPYNLSLFIFIFVYQFTGSFLVNTAEMLIWALVFCAHFPELAPHHQKNTSYESPVH